jgi:NAD(P)-dependent dehydrogenase (short-subunit alcohol dehydrogenase family)
MDDLSGRRIASIGGTGQVGEGIVRQLLAAGATVVVPGYSTEELDLLAGRLGEQPRLRLVEGGAVSDAEWSALAARLEADGPLDGVDLSIGRWCSGARMVEMPPAEWDRVMAAGLDVHARVARAFIPRLASRAGAAYVVISGSGAEEPAAGSAVANVAGAAELMLARVLAVEHADDAVRVHALVIDTPVLTRDRPTGPPDWVKADDVGAAVVRLVGAGTEPVYHLRPGANLVAG